MKNYNLTVTDSKYGIECYIGIKWDEQWPILRDNLEVRVNRTFSRNVNKQIRYEKDNITNVGEILTPCSTAKFINLSKNEETNENWALNHKDKSSIYQEYKVDFTYDTSDLVDLGYNDCKTVNCNVVIGITWLAHKSGDEYVYHVSELSNCLFNFDIDNIFDPTVKSIFEDCDNVSNAKILFDISGYTPQITFYYNTYKYKFNPLNVPTEFLNVTDINWHGEENTDNFVQFIFNSSSNPRVSKGNIWQVEFKIFWKGPQISRVTNFISFYDNADDITIQCIKLVSLLVEPEEALVSTINEGDTVKYLLRTNLARGVVGQSLNIVFTFGETNILFNHYDERVKHITGWNWIHQVNGSTVEEEISVYKYTHVSSSGINSSGRRTTCEIWYNLFLGEEKSLKLYQVRITGEASSPDEGIDTSALTDTPGAQQTDTLVSNTDDAPQVNATAGNPETPGVVESTEHVAQTGSNTLSIPGGRPEDIQALQDTLQQERTTVAENRESIRERINELKDNKKAKKFIAKAKLAKEIADKAIATYNAFKENLKDGIIQASQLVAPAAEIILEKLQEKALTKKLDELQVFVYSLMDLYFGQLQQLYQNTKTKIHNTLVDIRTGDEQVLTRINAIHEECIMQTREIFKDFITKLENEANRVIEAINLEFLNRTATEIQLQIAKAVKTIQDKAESLQTKISALAESKIDQLMSKLKAKSGQ